MARIRRIAAYGMLSAADGRLFLVRTPLARDGRWSLPGDTVAHGEDPVHTVVRATWQQTGVHATVVGVREVAAEVVPSRWGPVHTDGLLYELAGAEPPETDEVRRVGVAEGGLWTLDRFAAVALGIAAPDAPAELPSQGAASLPGPAPRPPRGQRFGAYGLVSDRIGRLLLTLVAEGYPGAGCWHMPGGGTDFGEQPRAGLRREIVEESGQQGEVGALLGVVHHHRPQAYGPEGYPVDWHSVAAVFRVHVATPAVPTVHDPGGSTAGAAWFTPPETLLVPLTSLASRLLQWQVSPEDSP